MSVLERATASIAQNSDVLRDISRPDCNLAVWQRAPVFAADALLQNESQDIRITVAADDPGAAFHQALSDNGFAKCEARDRLAEDVIRLCALFQPIAKTPELELRLETVTTNACRKFHADYVTARLITSYVGSGTEWLDAEDADRVYNGQEPRTIHRLTPGDVGIFKGKRATAFPAIHRSPPIEGTGEKRLLLVLNPKERGAE